MIHWLAHAISWTWGGESNPGGNPGYAIFSGPLPDVTLLGGLWLLIRRHNCGVKHCWRISLHKPTAAGDLVCRRHAPEGHHSKSHAQVLADHHEAKERA